MIELENTGLYILNLNYNGLISVLVIVLFIVMILYWFIKKIIKMNIHYNQVDEINQQKKERQEEKIKLHLGDITKEEAEKEIEEKYIEIQNALVNNDHVTLRRLCTDEVYNKYLNEIEILKKKNQQHIKSCILKEGVEIIDTNISGEDIIIEVGLDYTCYDYNFKNNIVIKGSKNYVSYFECDLVFIKTQNNFLLKKENVIRTIEK